MKRVFCASEVVREEEEEAGFAMPRAAAEGVDVRKEKEG